MRITALVPIYQQPKRAVEIVTRLVSEGLEDGEILLVVDGETNPEIAAALCEVRSIQRVRIIEGRPHLGKAEALNRAAKETEADVLAFIDNDIEVPEGVPFLSRCIDCLRDSDIAELPKIASGKGFLATMEKYEFFSNIAATEYIVRRTGRCPSMNGAAFLIKKELFNRLGGFRAVINEDMDMAGRAFLEGARFAFDASLTVKNEVPESVAVWIKQRRRWSVNSSLFYKRYLKRILSHDRALLPILVVSGLIFPLPLLAALAGALLPLIPASIIGADGLGTFLASLGGLFVVLGSVAIWWWRKSRHYESYFTPATFLLFTLVYLPIWGIAMIAGSLCIATGRQTELDWKFGTDSPGDAPRAERD